MNLVGEAIIKAEKLLKAPASIPLLEPNNMKQGGIIQVD